MFSNIYCGLRPNIDEIVDTVDVSGFFGGSSTEGHPTISNIVNHGLHWDLGRAAAFFGWLAFGKWLLER